jgi:hypothetical protein
VQESSLDGAGSSSSPVVSVPFIGSSKYREQPTTHQNTLRQMRRKSDAPLFDGYRKILTQVWRPAIGKEMFEKIRYSRLSKVVNVYRWKKKTYNNAVSALRCAFEYGYRDFPEKHNPASALKCLRITKKDRRVIDPFTIKEAQNPHRGNTW